VNKSDKTGLPTPDPRFAPLRSAPLSPQPLVVAQDFRPTATDALRHFPEPGVQAERLCTVCGLPDAIFFTPDGRLCGECAYSRGVRFAVPSPTEVVEDD
jgi:hypothetical protein